MVSAVDPKRTFLTLCDADHLPPEFLWRMKHYRSRGTLAKVNLALSALPSFTGATREMLAGRVRLAPDLDYLERAFDHAKYGRFSTAAVDRVHDSVARRSDARAAGRARAVGVRAVRAVHACARAIGTRRAMRSAMRWSRRWRNTRPDLGSLIVDRADADAARSRARLGTDRRPHFPRRAVARSVLHDAAAARVTVSTGRR